MSTTLISSPLQGFTDYRFRNAFQKYFGGIDTFYAPYIRLNGKLKIKPNYERDIALKNNLTVNVIPQVMTNDAEEFLFVVRYIRSLGYKELNWNLGCPYPMVVNKCMGSGLISEPQKIDHILKRVHEETDVTVSMKMRMGYEHSEEILDTFPILDKYPLKSIAIHARIGKQLYKGGVDLKSFARCLESTSHKIYYNGDITTVEGFRSMQATFPEVDHWLVGRGLIADPFLPGMIKAGTSEYPTDKLERFSKFHDTLFAEFERHLKGEKHVVMKMQSYWDYFSALFCDQARELKKIKKAKNFEEYDLAVGRLLDADLRNSQVRSQVHF